MINFFRTVLQTALEKNFANVTVEIIDMAFEPENHDLTKAPYLLASSGISGDGTIIEYGNDEYLIPLVDKSKVYDLIPVIREIESYKTKDFFAAGAGAGPFEYLNQNCEGMFNLKVYENGTSVNENHIARTKGEGIEVVKVPPTETRASLLGNIFLSEGRVGKVLKVTASNRTGKENFIYAMQVGLAEEYSANDPVGLGGVFYLKAGTANFHVMSDFSETPIDTDDDLNKWLTWHDFEAPLIALGNFVSKETDFKLRLQHFHAYSSGDKGGHYHNDTTPDTVQYEGYFSVVDRIILIDKSSAITRAASLTVIVLLVVIIKLFR